MSLPQNLGMTTKVVISLHISVFSFKISLKTSKTKVCQKKNTVDLRWLFFLTNHTFIK